MFKSTDYIHNINDVSPAWIFEYYLKTPKLTGQSIKIKSIFNIQDTNPSLIIYYNHKLKKYVFKDFSSGISGSAVDFMKKVWNCTFTDATTRIIRDYKACCSSYTENINSEITIQGWKVTQFKVRKWNEDDIAYWSQYKISISLLEEHNVKPLKFYTMSLINGEEIIETFTIKENRIYGYFYGTEEGNLAKIYQPDNIERKFIKVTNYIQGSDQNKKKK